MALTLEEEAKFRLMMASYDSGKTIPQMPVSTGLDGTELIEVIQNSVSKKSAISIIAALIDSYYVGSNATKTVKNSINATIAKSDFLGNQIDLTYARKDELSGWVIGDIKLHFGSLAGIGSDWHICDGGTYNGVLTPDMGGSYAIGYKASSPATPTTVTDDSENYGAIGNICGSNSTGLSLAQMPNHRHFTVANESSGNTFLNTLSSLFRKWTSNHQNGNQDYDDLGATTEPTLAPTASAGGGLPHENRPSSVVLAYIMKIA